MTYVLSHMGRPVAVSEDENLCRCRAVGRMLIAALADGRAPADTDPEWTRTGKLFITVHDTDGGHRRFTGYECREVRAT